MKEKCLVILSGGQDSTTCLFIAKTLYKEVHAITFDYGQRHRIEIDAALKVAEIAGVVSHRVIGCEGLLRSSSPLLDDDEELEQYQSYEQMDAVIGSRVELTFVPFRNPFFILLAANHALSIGADTLFTGVCQSDNANYPDCTDTFVHNMQWLLDTSIGRQAITLLTPLLYLKKKEICLTAKNLGAECLEALAYSHTSYDGEYPPTDMNHANVLRAKGFEDAGLPDPLVLRAVQEGLMELPLTSNYFEVVA